MRGYASSIWLFAGIISIAVGVASCATEPQPVAHDEADRLFLKIAEIAQRSRPPTSRDMEQVDALASRLPSDRIPTNAPLCPLSKQLAVQMLNIQLQVDVALPQIDRNWTQQSAELRKSLKDVQANGRDCGAFPPVEINEH